MKERIIKIVAAAAMVLTVFVICFRAGQKYGKWHDATVSIRQVLEEHGFDPADTSEESLVPIKLEDEEGNIIMIYEDIYRPAQNGERDTDPLMYTVFDPADALWVGEYGVGAVTGDLYEKGGLTYLWWEPAETLIFLIEFDESAVTLPEILMMARSMYQE